MDRSRKINLILTVAPILFFLLAGLAYLQAAASYSLSFTFCTEPGSGNADSLRCQAPLWYGYAFWALIVTGAALGFAAIVRKRRQRAAAP